jgi:hypothetical protein
LQRSQDTGENMATRFWLFGIAALTSLAIGNPAQASEYIVNLDQVGSSVVATGSGTIDYTDLPYVGLFSNAGGMQPNSSYIISGPVGDIIPGYGGGSQITGPTSFGSGDGTNASTSTGDDVGINFDAYAAIFVPSGYVSGDPLSGTATWDDATLASLGVTSGMYTWSWGTGDDAGSFVLDVGVTATPLPSTWTMLIAGFAGLGFFAYRGSKKNGAAVAAA